MCYQIYCLAIRIQCSVPARCWRIFEASTLVIYWNRNAWKFLFLPQLFRFPQHDLRPWTLKRLTLLDRVDGSPPGAVREKLSRPSAATILPTTKRGRNNRKKYKTYAFSGSWPVLRYMHELFEIQMHLRGFNLIFYLRKLNLRSFC